MRYMDASVLGHLFLHRNFISQRRNKKTVFMKLMETTGAE